MRVCRERSCREEDAVVVRKILSGKFYWGVRKNLSGRIYRRARRKKW
jgi:hypothetical protein